MNTTLRAAGPLGVLVWALASGSGAPAEEQVAAQPVAASEASRDPEPGWGFHLLAQEEYRLRAFDSSGAGPDERDHDLRLFLDAGLTSPDESFGMNLTAALWWDADGEPSSLEGQFAYREPWWDVFALSAEYRSDGVLRLARGGRQVSEHGEPIPFDGAALEVRAAGRLLDVFALGGRTVHFFELGADLFEDWLASAGLVLRPLEGLRLELDYRFQLEDVGTEEPVGRTQEIDHGYGLSLVYAHEDWLRLRVRARGIDAELARVGLDVHLEHAPWELGLDLRAEAQPATLDQLAERDDPLFLILGPSLPHLRWRLDAWKDFSTESAGRYGLHLGFVGRHLLSGEEGPFNRSLGHVSLAAVGHDLGVRGLWATLALEEHFTFPGSALSQDHHATVGAALGYAGGWLKIEAGTYYQRFKYDYFRTLREVADVRTVYGQLGFRPLAWLDLRARYEYEWTDRDVHTLTLTLAQIL